MKIGKRQAGGIDGFVWKKDGDVIEIPTALGLSLLKIGHADFFEPVPEPVEEEKPAVRPKAAVAKKE